MKKIPLGHGAFALVDDEDFERLNPFKWHQHHGNKTNIVYASRSFKLADGTQKGQLMHDLILPPITGFLRDHKDRNGCNNQKSNLRYCTNSQNMMNSVLPRNKTGFRGVSFDSRRKQPYSARLVKDRRRYYIGWFNTPLEAAKAWNEKAIELFGEFAVLNKI